MLDSAETLTRVTQEALLLPQALAREFSEADISRDFRANGSTDPDHPTFVAHAKNGFADWKLVVGGLVEEPLELSLVELRAMPSRTQITRHDCVEGWSCIGKWKGLRLSALLERARLKPDARYIVFYCADALGRTGTEADKYYESIGLTDAFHVQTILAYEMNDQVLSIPHGAPLRLRVERQLGYKMAKCDADRGGRRYLATISAAGAAASGRIWATSGTRGSESVTFGPNRRSHFWHLADMLNAPTNVRYWG